MTMTVFIRNDSTQYVARIEHHDEYEPQAGVRNHVATVARRLQPGEQTVEYATSSRSIHIHEEPLPAKVEPNKIDTIATAAVMGEGDDSQGGTGSG